MFVKNAKQIEVCEGVSKHDRILLYGGSGSGKSFIAVYIILVRALLYPNTTHLIVRQFGTSLRRSIWSQTFPKVIELYDNLIKYVKIDKTSMKIQLKNGSTILCLGCDQEEKILGLECSTYFIDESTEITYEQYQLLLSRLREDKCKRNKVILACNPTVKDNWLYKLFIERKNPTNGNAIENFDPFVIKLNPNDNKDHLPVDYFDTLKNLSDRARMRFWEGEWCSQVEGALVKYDDIENNRSKALEEYDNMVLAIDPALTNTEKSDETGLVICAKKDDQYYVIRDESLRGLPNEVVSKILEIRKGYPISMCYLETNAGGAWLSSAISNASPECPITEVHHKIGKLMRLEPVGFLYQKGLIHHVGCFTELEDQLVQFNGNPIPHDDRMDALVIGIKALQDDIKIDIDFAK